MGDSVEKLQRQLEEARKELAEAKTRCAQREADYQATTRELEETRRKIEQAHHEWITALDVLQEPVFLHDKDFLILRCNRAYQQRAGLPFEQIVGQPYYEIFPKTHKPLRQCFQTMEGESREAEDEVTVGETIYRSRSYAINNDQKNYLYAIHILQDITDLRSSDDNLRKSKDLLRSIVEHAPIRVFWKDKDLRYLGCNTAFAQDAGRSSPDELIGKDDFEMAWKDQAELYRADDTAVMESGKAKLEYEEQQTRPDGSTSWVSTSKVPLYNTDNRIFGMLGIYQDITQRKLAEQKLLEEKVFSDTLIQNLPDLFYVLDQQGNFLRWSDHTADLLGLTPEQMLKTNALAFVHEDDKAYLAQKLQEAFETGSAQAAARVAALRGIRYYTFSASRIETRFGTNLLGIGIDITERKLAADMLHESEERLRAIVEGAVDGIALADTETQRISSANPAMCRMLGYSKEELEQLRITDIHPQEGLPYVLEQFAKQLRDEIQVAEDMPIKRKDGSVFYADINSSRVTLHGKDYLLGIFRDISERKQTEAQLRESETAYRTLAQNLPGLVYRVFVRESANMEFFNDMLLPLTGCTEDELTTGEICSIESLIFEEDRPRVIARVKDALARNQAFLVDYRLRHKNGDLRWMAEHGMPVYGDDGKPLYIDGVIFDITERKLHEDEMHKVNRALSLLSECNTLLVHATNEQDILADICRLTVQTGGYLMAWVGFAEHDENKTVRPVARSGYEEGYLDNVKITWDDSDLGRGPTGTAIKTGQTVINQHILTNPAMKPWLDAALRRGYQASIALPLIAGEQAFGALTIYSVDPDAFTPEEVTLLEEMANDLAYGITTLRTRKEHEQHAVILRQSLEQSIQTVAATVETRDPYTAGHQRRVAELATAIAQEMGLPEEQINGLHLAATIHDLGKIHIPAEILSKPGRLSPIEFELIKTHPQEGYNILKDVKFPWPIADTILQHHERLDGSGYPQGLKDGKIILEAKILAVADVVEAITSHRPYRPGFGLDAALEEIELNRDKLYDAQVADACLRLFRERGYQLPS